MTSPRSSATRYVISTSATSRTSHILVQQLVFVFLVRVLPEVVIVLIIFPEVVVAVTQFDSLSEATS